MLAEVKRLAKALPLLLAVMALGCSDYHVQREPALFFEAPLLKDSQGLGGLVEMDAMALAYGVGREAGFSTELPFYGFIFAAASGDTADVQLVADDVRAAPALALYGPRAADGLFGAARAVSEPRVGTAAELSGISVPAAGDYLVLLADAAGRGGNFHLQLDCGNSPCGTPPCAALVCGLYCPAGLKHGTNGCPSSCDCRVACYADDDCPYGFFCRQGSCVAGSSCQCHDPYQPVCGKDGVTYANLCELGCAGAELDHAGPCDGAACASDADCPDGTVCTDGVCTIACECEGYEPVCGTDGRTYLNDCERRCAGVALDHTGPCDTCNPEMCDGLDNDCDGLIDEDACAGSCSADADCPTGQVCLMGSCAASVVCSATADCPAGQVCEGGLCRFSAGCGPEQCNGMDDDCDGQIDEGCPVECNTNNDCPTGNLCQAGRCVQGDCLDQDADGYTTCAGDCDDADTTVNPGVIEVCNGIDDDCDGQVDDGCYQTCTTDSDCDDSEPTTNDWCINSSCVHRPICTTDADCESGYICSNSECVFPCRTDSDCPAGETCQGGICSP